MPHPLKQWPEKLQCTQTKIDRGEMNKSRVIEKLEDWHAS